MKPMSAIQRNEIENLYKEDTRNANHRKGIEDRSCSITILIGLKQEQVEGNSTERYNRSIC